jgi:hypothetical protein
MSLKESISSKKISCLGNSGQAAIFASLLGMSGTEEIGRAAADAASLPAFPSPESVPII